MNRFYIAGSFLLAGALLSTVSAERLSPETALQRALGEGLSGSFRARSAADYRLAKTIESQGSPSVYLFNNIAGGFIVTPADDCAVPVLGYSTASAVGAGQLSPEFEWWLSEYGRQIAWARDNGVAMREHKADDRPAVEPLVRTMWNQDYPYNEKTPLSGGIHTYTGCVATAIAQVVNYHRWPETHGIGNYSYPYGGTIISFDYENTVFDWDNMIDRYDSSVSYRDEQIDAVATLMSACGVGVDMMYSTSGSGAHSFRVPRLLVENLGYDSGAAYLMRDFFTASEWERIVYEELAAGRPVLYAGQSDGGGHEFVCDGYGSDGFFHINWGWGGYCDGYFRLYALDPDGQGIGGSTTGNGFNYSQDITVGIRPPEDNSQSLVYLYCFGSVTPYVDIDEDTGLQYITFLFDDGEQGAYLFSYNDVDFICGARFETPEGDVFALESEVVTFPGTGHGSSISGIGGYSCQMPEYEFTEGSYKVFPCVRQPDQEWHDLLVLARCSRYAWMDVDSEGNVSFRKGEPGAMAELKVHGLNRIGNSLFRIDIENEGELMYSDSVEARFYDSENGDYLKSFELYIELPAQAREEVEIELRPLLPSGVYNVAFYDSSFRCLNDSMFKVEVEGNVNAHLNVLDLLTPENLVVGVDNALTLKVENNGSMAYDGIISMNVHSFQGYDSEFLSSGIQVDAWDSDEYVFYWNPVKKGEYQLSFYNYANALISGFYNVEVTVDSGISAIEADDASIEVWTAGGVPVPGVTSGNALSTLPNGIYIVRTGGQVFKYVR